MDDLVIRSDNNRCFDQLHLGPGERYLGDFRSCFAADSCRVRAYTKQCRCNAVTCACADGCIVFACVGEHEQPLDDLVIRSDNDCSVVQPDVGPDEQCSGDHSSCFGTSRLGAGRCADRAYVEPDEQCLDNRATGLCTGSCCCLVIVGPVGKRGAGQVEIAVVMVIGSRKSSDP